ncbi:MAG: hypothetical protein H6918_05420 [Sphingomonadaceae bacterium]|nr:hypothetical protein [Sphingomonadaceae bacterium]
MALWPVKIAPSYISGGLPHGLAFGLLTSLAFFAFPRLGIALLWRGLVLFGAAIEALQWTMPFGRAVQRSDFLLDSIVASIALLVLSVARIMAGWFRQHRELE